MSDQTIPVLKLTDFFQGGERQQAFVAELGAALQTIGFFALRDHGIPSELIQAAYAAAAAVFLLPDEQKARYTDLVSQGQRGFTAVGREHAKGSQTPDLKEFWQIGRATAQPPNIWPAEVPDFQPAILALFEHLERCAHVLLAACALSLGLPRSRFQDMTRDGPTLLRVLHYPPVPPHQFPTGMRAAPHEDINFITLLCEATAPGLELLQTDGRWCAIAPQPGQIIVDTGDMLQNLTNGLLRSTTHRVVNSKGDRARRFSLPFLYILGLRLTSLLYPSVLPAQEGSRVFPGLLLGSTCSSDCGRLGWGEGVGAKPARSRSDAEGVRAWEF